MNKLETSRLQALNLRFYKKRAGISSTELRKRLGMGVGSISKYSNGRIPLSRKFIEACSQELNLSTTETIRMHALSGYIPRGMTFQEAEPVLEEMKQDSVIISQTPILKELLGVIHDPDLELDKAEELVHEIDIVVGTVLHLFGKEELWEY